MVLTKPSTSIIIIIVLLILTLFFYSILSPVSPPQTTKLKTHKNPLPKSHFHDTFLTLASNYTVSNYLRTLTLHPHLAGTKQGHDLALYVKSHFDHLGLNTHVAEYQVLLSYPVNVTLSLVSGDVAEDSVVFKVINDGMSDMVQPYHAYSPSGTAVGQGVFVNYGRERDYEWLRGVGVNVSGCVAVVRRGGGVGRGEAVRRAAKEGAVGVIMYTESGYRRGVERGTVMSGVGDPMSPGWASVVEGGERMGRRESGVEERFPEIPSLPVSVETAEALLGSLEGPQVPQEWKEGMKFKVSRVGPGPTVLNFTYKV